MWVWVLRQEPPAVGMLREMFDGRPIVTASTDEAQRFANEAEAAAVAAVFPAGLVPMLPTLIEVHGPRRLRGE